MPRDLAISCDRLDCKGLLSAWAWLVPADHTPLMVGAFGDWIFGAPDGWHWALCLLEGDYRQIARDSAEFNRLKRRPENLEFLVQSRLGGDRRPPRRGSRVR